MSRILIAYGTTDGQTAKIANYVGEVMRAQGADVDVFDTATSALPEDVAGYSAVIVAASVHAGGYQRSVRRWVTRHATTLNAQTTAFVSVCLGVLEHKPAVDHELAEMLEKFFVTTGWRPTVKKIVAGALPYTRYGVFKRWSMRRIVAKAKGDVDTSRDYEYTDWDDVDAFARHFYDRVQLQLGLRSPAAAIA